ncbi:MAG: hypothetical protein JKY33_10605 [Bacteroidia bacterium]|nr:hypothetical protein [Bacteroidia bacterium]
MSTVIFYNKTGNPVECNDTPEDKQAMEKAGFTLDDPTLKQTKKTTKRVRED